MRDLVEFLTARLDEDEQTARNCVGDDLGWLWTGSGGHVKDADGCAVVAVEDYGPEVVEHIARHDPLRVLAEVKAKRALLRLSDGRSEWNQPASIMGYNAAYRDVLILLALPYADHPDYRQEWAP